MARCVHCGRAVLKVDATTFPSNDVVICGRASCESVARDAKDRYYNDGVDDLQSVLNPNAPD